MIYVSGRTIAALNACTLMAANKAMRAGRYGPLIFRDGVGYVALEAVERHTGQSFTPDQILHAAAGKPGRIITVPQSELTE
jgi:hypothetical protein